MYNTDIILSGHGSALANAMFARPHSVLIECHPPYFYELCFANIAFISRLFYIAVNNYDQKILMSGHYPQADRLYEKGEFYAKRRAFAGGKIYPNPLLLKSAIDMAIDYVERKQCVTCTNDYWSQVYYYHVCLNKTKKRLLQLPLLEETILNSEALITVAYLDQLISHHKGSEHLQ